MDIVWTPSGVLVAGPDSSPHQAELPKHGLTVGVRFRPGVGPLWLGVPANKILDDRVELRELWKEDARTVKRFARLSSPSIPALPTSLT